LSLKQVVGYTVVMLKARDHSGPSPCLNSHDQWGSWGWKA